MNLLLFHSSEKDSEGQLLVVGERAKHIREVLKLQVGDRIRVGEIGKGKGDAEVVAILDDGVRLRPGTLIAEETPAKRDLILAMPRPQSLKKILQSVATMDVGRLLIISSERVERSYFSSPLLKPESLFEHIQLGLEQGMSTLPPKVEIFPSIKPRNNEKFSSWLEEHFPKSDFQRTIGHIFHSESLSQDSHQIASAEDRRAETPLRDASLKGPEVERLGMAGIVLGESFQKPIVFAVGPEGGWSEGEVQVFLRNGFAPFSLGPRVLRVETAIVATLAQHDLLLMVRAGGASLLRERSENLSK